VRAAEDFKDVEIGHAPETYEITLDISHILGFHIKKSVINSILISSSRRLMNMMRRGYLVFSLEPLPLQWAGKEVFNLNFWL
jgi:hypothetical protein